MASGKKCVTTYLPNRCALKMEASKKPPDTPPSFTGVFRATLALWARSWFNTNLIDFAQQMSPEKRPERRGVVWRRGSGEGWARARPEQPRVQILEGVAKTSTRGWPEEEKGSAESSSGRVAPKRAPRGVGRKGKRRKVRTGRRRKRKEGGDVRQRTSGSAGAERRAEV